MADYTEDSFSFIPSKDHITVIKGGLYICEIRKSSRFNKVLAGNFNTTVGLSGDTLIALGEFINHKIGVEE